jgi:hypothetical protein
MGTATQKSSEIVNLPGDDERERILELGLARLKYSYVLTALDLGVWKPATLEVWFDGGDTTKRRVKMNGKKGKALQRSWTDYSTYRVVVSDAFIANPPLDREDMALVLHRFVESLPDERIALGKEWSARISTPYCDLYCHLIPRLHTIEVHLASEDPDYEAHMLQRIRTEQPETTAAFEQYEKEREAWRAARH